MLPYSRILMSPVSAVGLALSISDLFLQLSIILPYSKSVWMLPAPQPQPLKPPATQAIWMFEPDLHRMRSCA